MMKSTIPRWLHYGDVNLYEKHYSFVEFFFKEKLHLVYVTLSQLMINDFKTKKLQKEETH